MKAQQCVTCSEFPNVYVPSASDNDLVHEVIVNIDHPGEGICDCESYKFRGSCRHQEQALELICLWSDANPDDELQTIEQAEDMECPSCGMPTEWIDIDE